MIFVTVGTHEQGFNRLIESVDELVKERIITEDVFIQTGYSNYVPKYCAHSEFVDYRQMQEYLTNSSIVITHGGPSTFMVPISNGIPTIVMPREKKFNEHVNDHQLDFCNRVIEEGIELMVVTNVVELKSMVVNSIIGQKNTNNMQNKDVFVNKFEILVNDLLSKKEKK